MTIQFPEWPNTVKLFGHLLKTSQVWEELPREHLIGCQGVK
jgi:hypothetical protein